MQKIVIQAVRDGYRRFGRPWTVKPQLIEVRDFDPEGDRPEPKSGAWVISPAEASKLEAYAKTPNAQLRCYAPDEVTVTLSEEARELAEMGKAREQLEAELRKLDDERTEAEARLAELREQSEAIEKLVRQAEGKARTAEEAAVRAEERYREAQAALEEVQENRRARPGKGK